MKTRFHTHPSRINHILSRLCPGYCFASVLLLASAMAADAYAAESIDSVCNSGQAAAAEYVDSVYPSMNLNNPGALMITPPEDDPWWQRFGDSALTTLIQTAMHNNYDLKSVLASIEASRQSLRQIYSGYYPTIGLNAGYNIGRESGKDAKPYSSTPTESYFSLGASLSWEIDVFGRIHAKAKSGKATLRATRLEYDALMLSLAAEVAAEYSELVMDQAQLRVAQEQLASQEEVLNIVRARYKAGLVSKLDVAQAENMVSTTRLMLPKLQAGIAVAKNSLMSLCVIDKSALDAITANSTVTPVAPPTLTGVTVEMVRRRPDIAEVESRIDALAANIGVAKKDYLPYLSLSASVGTSAHEIGKLFSSNSMTYSIAPQLTWTLFDGFSRSAGVAEAKAEMESEIDSYKNSVQGAVQEVDNALANYNAAAAELAIYKDVVATSEEMVSLAIDRYKLGLTDFSDVASAQQTYLDNLTSLETSRANSFNSVVTLYKALGGGW